MTIGMNTLQDLSLSCSSLQNECQLTVIMRCYGLIGPSLNTRENQYSRPSLNPSSYPFLLACFMANPNPLPPINAKANSQ